MPKLTLCPCRLHERNMLDPINFCNAVSSGAVEAAVAIWKR